MLVFSVTPFKIDQNKNQNRSIDKVQNLGNERRYIYKDPGQDSGKRNISYTRYPKNVLGTCQKVWGGGGWPEHLEMWVIKTNDPPPPFGTKMTDPPLKQGWKLHDPPPS